MPKGGEKEGKEKVGKTRRRKKTMDKEKMANLLYTISFQNVAIIMSLHSFLSYALLSNYLPVTILLCPYSDIHLLKLTHKFLPNTTRDWHVDVGCQLADANCHCRNVIM